MTRRQELINDTARARNGGETAAVGAGAKERSVLAQIASLKLLATPVLKARWRDLFGTEPPAYNRRFLESRLAYRIQELAYGGLKPETIERLEALGEQLDGGNPIVRRTRTDMKPIAGTRLIREWKGVEHCVTVLDDGYEYQGRPFKSLSAVARTITGTRWNGLTFFGFARRNGTSTRKNNNKLCPTDRKPAVKGAASL